MGITLDLAAVQAMTAPRRGLGIPIEQWKAAGMFFEAAAYDVTLDMHEGVGQSGLAGSWTSILPRVRKDKIVLGVESSLPYAAILNFGGTVRAKKAKFLTIPISSQAKAFATARQQPNLVAIPGRKPNTLVLIEKKKGGTVRAKAAKAAKAPKARTKKRAKKAKSAAADRVKVHWYLVKSVEIPKGAKGSGYWDWIRVEAAERIVGYVEEVTADHFGAGA